jgi:beta-N-acetylhexosaminidase
MTTLAAHAAQPLAPDAQGEQWARKTLAQMTTEEKVGQLIMVWAKVRFLNTDGPEYADLLDQMHTYHVGGFGVTVQVVDGQLMISEPLEAAALTNRLQRASKYPVLCAADFERGLSMRLNGATPFPAAMAFGAAGDVNLAREFGRISALESRAIGIEWNWFPVADVNSNPDNPIIDTRSFSEDPQQVAAMVAAYIEGAHQAGMMTTIKHFPGHGDTNTDSHLALARVDGSMERLNAVELVPFRAGIAAGTDSVMVGHLIVPAIEPNPNKPASISSNVITDLLQKQMGFAGLTVTDAIDMNGLKQVFHGTEAEISGQEAVAAIEAGNDMIIIPGDLGGAYNGLLRAVQNGRIPQERIDKSVLKILRMKAAAGLDRNRLVDLAEVERLVGRSENQAVAKQVAERAITLVKDEAHQLPLRATVTNATKTIDATPTAKPEAAETVAVILTDHARSSESGRAFAAELQRFSPGATVYFVDALTAGYQREEILKAAAEAHHVIAVAEAMPNPRRTTAGHTTGSAALDSQSLELLSALVATAPKKTIVAALGNPYTGGALAGLETYLCTFSDTPLSATSLAGALYGQTPIHGRLPVTIPGLATRGAGLDRVATTTSSTIVTAVR